MLNMKLGKPKTETTIAQAQVLEAMQPPPYQNEAIPSEAHFSDSLPNDLPDHFDELIGEAEVKLGLKSAPGPELLSPEEFNAVFCGSFKFAHHLSGLKALNIGPHNEEAARGASRAIYDTLLDIPMLRGLLNPGLGGKWLERGFAVAALTVPMAQAINAELAAKRHTAPQQNSPGTQSAHHTQNAKAATAPGEPDALAAAALTGV